MHTSSVSTATPDNPIDLREAALTYWADHGWPALVGPNAVSLQIQADQYAVSVSGEFGAQLLRNLSDAGSVLELPTPGSIQWVFLVSGDGSLASAQRLPGATIAQPGATVPLPPSELPHGPVRWIHRVFAGGHGLSHSECFDEAVELWL